MAVKIDPEIARHLPPQAVELGEQLTERALLEVCTRLARGGMTSAQIVAHFRDPGAWDEVVRLALAQPEALDMLRESQTPGSA